MLVTRPTTPQKPSTWTLGPGDGGRGDGLLLLSSVEELVEGAWVETAPLEAGVKAYGAAAVPEGLVCT